MLPAPILAAMANSSAINARLNAGSCWRQSATNHWPSTERLHCEARLSSELSTTGNASAAPINSAAISTKPLIRLSPKVSASSAITPAMAATQAWRRNQRAWA
ncbi:hypothetical protein D3C81_1418060 [compost metagenome]